MFNPKLEIAMLFVKNPLESGKFYRNLFGLEPVEQSPTYVMFVLPNGVKFGLWSQYTAEPTIEAKPGASEVCFTADDVDETYEKWGAQGLTIAQKPTDMDFGRTFVALDPDGHRIRVYKLRKQN